MYITIPNTFGIMLPVNKKKQIYTLKERMYFIHRAEHRLNL